MMEQKQGTPIRRSGGYSIRVGWRAAAYSVDRATEKRYWLMKRLLLLLAIILGIIAAYAAEHTLFEIIGPLVSERTGLIKNYPGLWQFLIYTLTLVCGGLIYLQIISLMGYRMVRDAEQRDEGFSMLEQRRRAAQVRKRDILFYAVILALIWTVPVSFGGAVKMLLSMLVVGRAAEITYFRFFDRPDR